MPDRSDLRFAVLQPGARMHYAVPALLQRAGMLQRFYTDFCSNVGAVRYAERIWPEHLQPAAVRRMLGRKLPPGIPHAKVRQVRGASVRDHIGRTFGHPPAASKSLLDLARSERLGGANAIYTVLINEDIDLCREAKERGCCIVHEVMIGPDVGLWLDEEYRNHPTVARALPPLNEIQQGRERDRRKYDLADLILVPSEFTRRAVIELGADPNRVALVPYGIAESWLDQAPNTIAGRVVFVGSVGLRKGNHYLAEATRRLIARKIKCDVRVVGPAAPSDVERSMFAGPTYVGQVPRARVREEFLSADVFVLPTLCESFGLVHLEAMACGVPVVTTPNCGSIVRDGIDGFIVPVRDAVALADAIERIITDRNLRDEMSQNARKRAAEFTWERYGERLVGALSGLQSGSRHSL